MAHPAVILAEGDVENPMQDVLDAPVAADGLGQDGRLSTAYWWRLDPNNVSRANRAASSAAAARPCRRRIMPSRRNSAVRGSSRTARSNPASASLQLRTARYRRAMWA